MDTRVVETAGELVVETPPCSPLWRTRTLNSAELTALLLFLVALIAILNPGARQVGQTDDRRRIIQELFQKVLDAGGRRWP